MQVSLDSEVRELVNEKMSRPTARTFIEAQEQVAALMAADSFPRFVNSKLFKALLNSYGSIQEL